MRSIFVRIKLGLEMIRCFPHLLFFAFHRNKKIIHADIERWLFLKDLNYKPTIGFLYLLSFYPEFRNLFYHRIGLWSKLLNIICPKLSTLYIYCKDVGKGLFIQHGFATIINASSIGENCWINQQVTIGFSNKTDCPVIKDNVTISAGAKIIGGVVVGSNCKVGANAVVVKSVPDNCTVIGVPAYIVRRDGIRVTEKL